MILTFQNKSGRYKNVGDYARYIVCCQYHVPADPVTDLFAEEAFIAVIMLIINSLLSVIVFKLLRFSWQDSMYAGALLSQTGEFGLLACSLAYQLEIINYNFLNRL